MTQPELIETKSTPVEYIKGGMIHRNHGNWTERNFHGFRQVRYTGEPWIFYICGFCGPQLSDGSDGIGHVQMWGCKEETACQMDTKGRVRIFGKWYKENRWDH